MGLVIKQGDTRQAVKATLKNEKGQVISLEHATVNFVMATLNGDMLVNRPAAVQEGYVVFSFDPGETEQHGKMNAEFQVTYQDGREEIFPSEGYLSIEIQKRLGGI